MWDKAKKAMDQGDTQYLHSLVENMARPCTWFPDLDHWATECGQIFVILDGTPAENGMRYCTYCGRKIVMEEKL